MSLLTTQQEIKLQRINGLPPIQRKTKQMSGFKEELRRTRQECVFNDCGCFKFKPIRPGGTRCERCLHDIVWHARPDESSAPGVFPKRLQDALEKNKKLLSKILTLNKQIKKLENNINTLENNIKKLENNIKTCIICSENQPNVLLTPCNHAHFCKNCIDIWSRSHKTCPTCRKRFIRKIKYVL